jgi:FkbM family methyltransferase
MKTFVEIGSCYFDTLYPLLEQGWKGYMIDPVREYLDKIPHHDNLNKMEYAVTSQKLYKTPTLGLTHVAKEHYAHLGENGRKDYDGMGSTQPFRTGLLLGKLGNYNPGDIQTKIVPTVSLNWVIDYFKISKIDLLKIDTEGADFDILASIDLKKVKVDEIRIEHKHYDDIFMNKYFKMNGYETQFDPNDWSTIIAKKIR